MERMEKNAEQGDSSAPFSLEHILTKLDSMSESLDKLALLTQMKQCDLIVCFGHPDKMAALRKAEGAEPWAVPNPEE